ncbi:formate dehydrogenase [Polaromonas sp. P2-4]|nr:formate dehydrogenase [Polaromonas sp. P2-4]
MQESQPKPSRRSFFSVSQPPARPPQRLWLCPVRPHREIALEEPKKPVPEKGGGYSLSEHVKRYYKTARI